MGLCLGSIGGSIGSMGLCMDSIGGSIGSVGSVGGSVGSGSSLGICGFCRGFQWIYGALYGFHRGFLGRSVGSIGVP